MHQPSETGARDVRQKIFLAEAVVLRKAVEDFDAGEDGEARHGCEPARIFAAVAEHLKHLRARANTGVGAESMAELVRAAFLSIGAEPPFGLTPEPRETVLPPLDRAVSRDAEHAAGEEQAR